jgi:hypothetical protein
MRITRPMLAAAAAALLGAGIVATPGSASADPPWRHGWRDHGHWRGRHYHAPPPPPRYWYRPPPPVYYAPPPPRAYYVPPPVYYAPPPPPVYVPPPGVGLYFRF